MTKPNPGTPEYIYHLMLLSLTWAQEARADNAKRQYTGWTGHFVLLALGTAGAISVETQERIARSVPEALKNHMLQRTQIVPVSGERNARGQLKPPTQRQLRSLMGDSKKHILAVQTTALFATDLLFQADTKIGGYPLFVTNLGVEYANGIADWYAQVLPKEKFLEAWNRHLMQLRAMHERRRRPR